MSKNHKNNPYREVYKNHYGEIPNGMHIHHVDKNPKNNNIENLICLTAEEHFAIHENEFIKWASVGGSLGGEKAKNEKLGWHNPLNKRKPGLKQPEGFSEEQSKRLKNEYNEGKRISWMKSGKFTPEQISNLISNGDPGKGRRGKVAWSRGKQIILKDKESANRKKSESAFKRKKYTCDFCQIHLDGGNFNKYMYCKHSWDAQKILNFKQTNKSI